MPCAALLHIRSIVAFECPSRMLKLLGPETNPFSCFWNTQLHNPTIKIPASFPFARQIQGSSILDEWPKEPEDKAMHNLSCIISAQREILKGYKVEILWNIRITRTELQKQWVTQCQQIQFQKLRTLIIIVFRDRLFLQKLTRVKEYTHRFMLNSTNIACEMCAWYYETKLSQKYGYISGLTYLLIILIQSFLRSLFVQKPDHLRVSCPHFINTNYTSISIFPSFRNQ